MNNPERLNHGGRLSDAARRWGIPPEQWLDLSTGINPRGWPVPVLPDAAWQRLPEEEDGLESIIRHWAHAPNKARCLAVAGSQAAIQALPGLRPAGNVGIPVPGYQEHGHRWSRLGHRIIPLSPEQLSASDHWLDGLDVLVLINPNNPTGARIPAERLLAWHDRLQSRGGWLIVDEAFMETRDADSLAPFAGLPGLVVLRSLGKFFGLAGVRAGAVLTDEIMARALDNELGPWAVSGPARHVLAGALADTRWQAATSERLLRDSEHLHQLLARHQLPGSTGTLLFRYVAHPRAEAMANLLASHGILVRFFDSPPALRLGLPGDPAQWQRLDAALAYLSNVIDQ